jgi:hypothetical protein
MLGKNAAITGAPACSQTCINYCQRIACTWGVGPTYVALSQPEYN